MSDAAAKTNQPTSGPVPPAHRPRGVPPFLIWLLILAMTSAAFAAAVVYSGGVGGSLDVLSSIDVERLLAQIPFLAPSSPGPPASSGASTTSTTTASTTDTPPPLPDKALELMYKEQLRSQAALGALVQGHIDAIEFGTPVVGSDSATIPVSASYPGVGTVFTGTMVLRKNKDLWYFDGLRDKGKSPDAEVANIAVDPNVVKVLTQQQALPDNQRMLTEGVLGGGFRKATVERVVRGAGTTTVDMRLSGGSWVTAFGRFVVIAKTEGSTTYWFLARLDQQ
jgi:hypothetical protein